MPSLVDSEPGCRPGPRIERGLLATSEKIERSQPRRRQRRGTWSLAFLFPRQRRRQRATLATGAAVGALVVGTIVVRAVRLADARNDSGRRLDSCDSRCAKIEFVLTAGTVRQSKTLQIDAEDREIHLRFEARSARPTFQELRELFGSR